MKKCLQNQQITLKDAIDQSVSSLAAADSDRPMSAVVLITAGCILGLFIMFAVQKCQPEPVIAYGVNDIRCSFCHYERVVLLDTNKKYKAHHRKKRALAFNQDKENEYLVGLIAGGKP